MMLKDRDIVIIGLQSWDTSIGSNCKDIAEIMSKDNRVLYVNRPFDFNQLVTHQLQKGFKSLLKNFFNREKTLLQLHPNLWNYDPKVILFSANWIKSRSIFNFFNKVNNFLFAVSIKKALKQLGISDFILFNDNDIYRGFYMKDFLQPDISVYYCRDYLPGVSYWKHHGTFLEQRIIAKADVCVANSTFLTDYCKQYNPFSFYVGQGCDLSLYTRKNLKELPFEIITLKRPVIGYIGALTSIRLDVELITTLAQRRPDWSFVLTGPEDENFSTSELHNLKNVHFTGAVDIALLPSYINTFDVCINPQLVNDITIGNYPRKLDEYLAMGKPVVATKTKAMSVFAKHVYLADNGDSFLELIEKALVENNEALQNSRQAFASSHTWENSVQEIYKSIAQVSS